MSVISERQFFFLTGYLLQATVHFENRTSISSQNNAIGYSLCKILAIVSQEKGRETHIIYFTDIFYDKLKGIWVGKVSQDHTGNGGEGNDSSSGN